MANRQLSRAALDNMSHDELAAYAVQLQTQPRRRAAVAGADLEDAVSAVLDRRSGTQGRAADADAGTYRVTAPGYSEQFTSKRQALASFEKLKARMIKNEQAAVVRLSAQDAGKKWQTVQEVKLNEDHF